MTRGKNARLTANRAVASAHDAEGRLRSAEQETRRLAALVAAKDREIAQLKSALIEARHERTTPGTYTDADVARIRQDARQAHRTAVAAGFAIFSREGAKVLPRGGMAELAEAFDVEPNVLLSSVPMNREGRRTGMGKARLIDELVREGVLR